ncbi:MAG: LysE family translocator [Paracoccaceae bacterium]
MTHEILAGLAVFAFVSSVTPGPNNMMLMASGANFGFRRTIPHMLGVALGFTAMVILVGAGLAGVFDAWPPATIILKTLSVVYLLYLAWRIATAAPPKPIPGATGARPMRFIEAALFQWVNPKAWTMALTAISVYAPDRSLAAIAVVALIFGLINLPTVSSWAAIGQEMRRVLTRPSQLRAFNITMALLLVASLWPVLAP